MDQCNAYGGEPLRKSNIRHNSKILWQLFSKKTFCLLTVRSEMIHTYIYIIRIQNFQNSECLEIWKFCSENDTSPLITVLTVSWKKTTRGISHEKSIPIGFKMTHRVTQVPTRPHVSTLDCIKRPFFVFLGPTALH